MTEFTSTKIEFVDLGLSVRWTHCNVGASSPEDSGVDVSYSECEKLNTELESQCKVPSREEWQELMRECTWRFTTQNGVKGDLVVGPNGNSIFLPSSFDDGKQGKYWSSSSDENEAYYLDFDFIGVRINKKCRTKSLCIRFVEKL